MSRRDGLLIRKVALQNGHLAFTLRTGRTLFRNLSDFPRIAQASATRRALYRIEDQGAAVRWPQLDEEIGAAQLLGVPERTVAVASGDRLRLADAKTLKLEGERKQEIVDDIAKLIGRPPRKLGRGSKELRAMLLDIVDALRLECSRDLTKPELAAAIVRAAGLRWTKHSDSTRTPSGGGGTITRVGLQQLRYAVERLVKRG